MLEEIKLLKERVDELEQRESFHELTIETLNQCLIDQQNQMDDLKHEFSLLAKKVLNEFEEPQALQVNERPPHY